MRLTARHRVLVALAEAVTPADGRPVACDDDLLRLERRIGIGDHSSGRWIGHMLRGRFAHEARAEVGRWRGVKRKGKTSGSLAARRPPVPTDSHAEIADWMIGNVMPRLHPIVQRLDELIREMIPGLQYAIKWKKAYYGLPELGWMIEIVAYDVSVNVVFFGGAEFDPPPPLGTTDRSRYVKLTTLEEAQTPMMREWIEQARRVRGWQ